MPSQARIKYFLSEEGRRDSLRKDGDGRRIQEVTGVVSDDDLGAFSVADDGQVSFDATTAFYPFDQPEFTVPTNKASWMPNPSGGEHIEWHSVPTWEDLVSVARKVEERNDEIAAFADEQAEREARIAKDFLENPTARATKLERDYVIVGGKRYSGLHAVGIEARRRWDADQEQLKKSNRATMSDWIARNGTENQRQRLLAGLLPWKEAYAAMDEYLYRPLENVPLYERFDAEQVCRCKRDLDEDPCDVKFKSIDATELSAEEWDQFSKIQAAVPGAAFQLREHRAQCVSAPEQIARGVIVKFTLGQLGFKREFAL